MRCRLAGRAGEEHLSAVLGTVALLATGQLCWWGWRLATEGVGAGRWGPLTGWPAWGEFAATALLVAVLWTALLVGRRSVERGVTPPAAPGASPSRPPRAGGRRPRRGPRRRRH